MRKAISKFWVLSMVLILTALSVLPALAADIWKETNRCTNYTNQGIEYYIAKSMVPKEADYWRDWFTATVTSKTATTAEVVAVEMTVANTSTRYQCTEHNNNSSTDPNQFACTSLPVDAAVTGIYMRLKPGTLTKDAEFTTAFVPVTNSIDMSLTATGKVVYPPYPCSANSGYNTWMASGGTIPGTVADTMTINSREGCTPPVVPYDIETDQSQNPYLFDTAFDSWFTPGTAVIKEPMANGIWFDEPINDRFSIVNIGPGETLDTTRFRFGMSPSGLNYSFAMRLYFAVSNNGTALDLSSSAWLDTNGYWIDVAYDYKSNTFSKLHFGTKSSVGWDILKIENLPLKLIFGKFVVTAVKPGDSYGLPTSTDFSFQLWYENKEGTLGYENSAMHFTRSMLVRFAPSCTQEYSATSKTPVSMTASSYYDPCQSEYQLFTGSFADSKGNFLYLGDNTSYLSPYNYSYAVSCANSTTDRCFTYTGNNGINHVTTLPAEEYPKDATNYYFITRKCTDSTCKSTEATGAYPYAFIVQDGDNTDKTYTVSGKWENTVTYFAMRLFQRTDPARPFLFKYVRFMAPGPGTYEVRGFVTKDKPDGNLMHDSYGLKFYVTVPNYGSEDNCSTPATNGYYTSLWNDCLDSGTTQLISFTATSEDHRGYIRNESNQWITFSFSSQYSYLPTVLEMESLQCEWLNLTDGGLAVENASCNPGSITMPPYTQVKILGGKFYLHNYPEDVKAYHISYIREDTLNEIELITEIGVKPCPKDPTIPNTGLSLRSPIHLSAKPQSSDLIFTGNSIRIPAIGVGMEYPTPIVHVYYMGGDRANGWDLGMLGGYIGELEGGTYFPYAGNTVLTGHYYSNGVFKNLEGINLDDEISIFGSDGSEYIYRVTEKMVTEPDDLYAIFQPNGEYSLTLVTCDNYNLVTDEYERRRLVRATLSRINPAPAAAETTAEG